MQHMLTRVHDRVTQQLAALGGFALCGIFLTYCLEVVLRYFLHSPTVWTNYVVSYSLCIAVCLYLPELARTRGHVTISILPDSLHPEGRDSLIRALFLISAIVCAMVTWISLNENIRQYYRGTTTSPIMGVPKYWISLFITYAFFNTTLHFVRHAFGNSGSSRHADPGHAENSAA